MKKGKRIAMLALFLFIEPCFGVSGAARDRIVYGNDEAPVTYDELSVLVVMDRYKDYYVNALYSSDGLLYICVEDLIKPVGISCILSQHGDSLSGYWGDNRLPFLLDYNTQTVQLGKKSGSYHRGLVLSNGTLYMESTIFVNVFGMTMNFNFRMLTLKASLGFEPPIFKQQRLDKQRIGVGRFGEDVVADSIVKRNYHLFRSGTFDWSVLAYQKWKGQNSEYYRAGAGAELLYGQADFSAYYHTSYKFSDQNLYYLWKWVDNDKSLIRQAQVGRINYQSIAFTNAPLIGASVRNTPTTLRKTKGYYTISEVTEPNWTIELYINDVLVDYTKADASGLFSFKVPLVYGYSRVKLKYYGPLGEERIDERSANLPYSLVPKGEFDYGLAGGVVQDTSWSKFGKAEVSYGITNYVAVGGGVEYLSSIKTGEYIPFARFAVQPLSRMIVSGEYAHDVKTQGILSYYFWKDLLLEFDYTKYVEGQKATISTALGERKARLFIPFKIKSLPFLTRFEFTQQVYRTMSFNYASAMLSFYYRQFSANSTTSLNWVGSRSPETLSTLALSYRLPLGINIRPSVLANVSDSKVLMYRAEIEKIIPWGYASVSYQHFVQNKSDILSLNLRYDLSFARVGITASQQNRDYVTQENAQGGMAFGGGNGYTYMNNNSSVGKGGILLFPYLDLNQNGEFDKGEKMIHVSGVKIVGGKVLRSTKDSIIRVVDLMPFTYQIIELEDENLDNISWRFKHKTYKVLVDPNQFKRVDVPIIVVGEANGVVSLSSNSVLKGLGRILVKIYRKGGGKPVAEMLSESDGYISYLGLAQGNYVACVDSTQLQRLDYTSTPKQMPFIIKALEEGDIVSNLNFTLGKNNEEHTLDGKASDQTSSNSSSALPVTNAPMSQPSGKKENGEVSNTPEVQDDGRKSIGVVNGKKENAASKAQNQRKVAVKNANAKLLWGEECAQNGSYSVQCGSYRKLGNAMARAKNLKKVKGMSVGVVIHRGFYKVRVGCVPSKKSASSIKRMVPVKDSLDEPLVVKRKKTGI